MISPHQRKQLGIWGEHRLDQWMQSQGWQVNQSNVVFRGGEIDRVYAKMRSKCFAEIKVRTIQSVHSIHVLFSEVEMSRLIRNTQIYNLYRFANAHHNKAYVRLFLFAKFTLKDGENAVPHHNDKFLPSPLCKEKDYWLFSITPELTPHGQQHSLLQTQMRRPLW